MPVDHYENFPVASWLLPRRLRPPVEAIYAFARGADDIADEGEASDAERLVGLKRYAAALDAIEARNAPLTGFDEMRQHLPGEFMPIGQAVAQYNLPLDLLRDLIDAFSQDVVKKRYADFAELMDYSRRSANPIGRLLLHLFKVTGSEVGGRRSEELSDNICSALQIINFWQDVEVDWRKGRVYIPQEDLRRFGVDESQIAQARVDERWTQLMAFECDRARKMLASGAPLGRTLPGRVGLEIRATVAGGAAILDKIDAAAGDVFRHRPVLNALDWTRIVIKSL